jgi:glyoxylase-like metal-dependent hydrolase (beta-lactamase superfamily II)
MHAVPIVLQTTMPEALIRSFFGTRCSTRSRGMRLDAVMRRALLACALYAAALASAAQDTPMRAVQVAPHAWYVQGESALGARANRNFISNAGFVVTPGGVVVVDALGSPALARELLKTIAAITPQPVKLVILTHYHADHVYGAQVFKAAGATVVAHGLGREYLGTEAARLRLNISIDQGLTEPGTTLVAADTWLDGSASFDVGGTRFEAMQVGPAHTAEDLAVFFPAEGVLFAGDLVFRGRVPFVGVADSRRWIESLDRLLALPAKVIVPGHGPHSTQPRDDLQLTRDYLAYLRQAMGRAARELTPFDEAYAATDWSRFESLPLFRQANRMNAYNTYLLMEQER